MAPMNRAQRHADDDQQQVDRLQCQQKPVAQQSENFHHVSSSPFAERTAYSARIDQ
jgi:hypothetical protein